MMNPQTPSSSVPPSSPFSLSVHIKFVEKNGKESDVEAPMGKSLMEVAHENDIDLEGKREREDRDVKSVSMYIFVLMHLN